MINLGSILPVGTIIHSMLTTSQFSAEYGSNWILADGASVIGSKYAAITGNTNVPDMRGRFLRGKGANNPDGDLALGTYTADKVKTHLHQQTMQKTNYSVAPALYDTDSGSTSSTEVEGLTTVFVTTVSSALNTQSAGDNESAPKSITVNIFIRIN